MSHNQFNSTIKKIALKNYLDGYTVKEIQAAIAKETKRKCAEITIYTWITRGKWKELKLQKENETVAEIVSNASQDYLDTIQKQREVYQKIWRKGGVALDDPAFVLTDPKDILAFADKGIRGERLINEELVNRAMMHELFELIKNIVRDLTISREEILPEISRRAYAIYQKYAEQSE